MLHELYRRRIALLVLLPSHMMSRTGLEAQPCMYFKLELIVQLGDIFFGNAGDTGKETDKKAGRKTNDISETASKMHVVADALAEVR